MVDGWIVGMDGKGGTLIFIFISISSTIQLGV